MLGLDAKFLCLYIDFNVIDFGDIAFFLSLTDDPATKLIIYRIASAFPIFVIVFAKNQLLLEVVRELLLTGFDSLGRHINSPFVVLNLNGLIVDFLCLRFDSASKLIITTSFN